MKTPNVLVKQTMRHLLLSACGAALGVALMIAPAQADTVTPPPVPADIAVPAGAVAFLVAPARGTQNYVCLPSATSATGVAFRLFTPEATLFKTDVDQQLITHFFSLSPGPDAGEVGQIRATWQDSQDTSTFWGKVTGTATSGTDPTFPGIDPNAIAWLRLARSGVKKGPDGGDRLSETTFVQRVNTSGGLAPSTDCTSPADVGHEAFVGYTANYVFYHGGLN